jgi:hypothetical protein
MGDQRNGELGGVDQSGVLVSAVKPDQCALSKPKSGLARVKSRSVEAG